jgi:hypothetical protein
LFLGPGFWALFRLDFSGKNKVWSACCDASILAFRGGSGVIFLIAIPPKALMGTGFAKQILQNPDVEELRSKNIENKRLRPA